MRANRQHHKYKFLTGLTLIELLVTIAIAAALLVVAVPGMQNYFIANRLVTSTNDFVAALNTARSEAIRRGVSVSLRKNSATAGDWGSAGWTMFVDNAVGGTVGTLDAGEVTLKVGEALPTPLTLYANNNFTNYISFKSTGEANQPGTFVFCHDGLLQQGGSSRSRAVVVIKTGRVRVATDTDGDGIPNKDGDPSPVNVTSCTNP